MNKENTTQEELNTIEDDFITIKTWQDYLEQERRDKEHMLFQQAMNEIYSIMGVQL